MLRALLVFLRRVLFIGGIAVILFPADVSHALTGSAYTVPTMIAGAILTAAAVYWFWREKSPGRRRSKEQG